MTFGLTKLFGRLYSIEQSHRRLVVLCSRAKDALADVSFMGDGYSTQMRASHSISTDFYFVVDNVTML